MSKSIISRLMAGAVATLLVLSGCSDNGESADETVADVATTETADDESPEAATDEVPAERHVIRVGMIPGFPSISMANLLEENEAGTSANEYVTTLSAAPDELVAKMTSGELDAATVPTNMAANLYNRTDGEVKIAAINTLGVIKIVSMDPDVTELDDIRGLSIDASGKGAIPEYTLRHVLDGAGIDFESDVDVTFYPGHDEVASRLIAGQATHATIPEPTLSAVMAQVPELHIVADLTEEWNELYPDVIYSQGVLVMATDFIEQNPDAAAAFLEEYEESARLVNEDVEGTAVNTGEFDIVPEAVAREAIPRANQVFITGEEMKEGHQPFYQILFDGNPESVGGSVPDDDFYYIP